MESNSSDNDPGVAPGAKNSPAAMIGDAVGSFAIWLQADRRHKVIAGLGSGLGIALIGCAVLLARGPEIITVATPVDTPDTKVVEITLEHGQTLFDVTDAHMPRFDALGLNLDGTQANTAWCDKRDTPQKRTTGMCRRVDIAGYKNLAPDGWREGQKVKVRVPTNTALASTHTATP